MEDAIRTIMVEVLYILTIATKERKQGRTSKSLLYKHITVDVNISEKSKEAGQKDGCVEEAR
jgi:hypothetical protein